MMEPVPPGVVRVLLVDDDPDDQLITEGILARAARTRFSLRTAPDARGALEALAAGVPDVALVDHRLGGGSGLLLLRELQARLPLLPVILLTGQDSAEVNEEAMRSGATDYLVKGELTPALLERAVRHALERARLERSRREVDLRYRMLVESVGAIVWNGDPHTLRFTYVSPEAEALLGYPVRDWLEDPDFWVRHIHPDDRDWAVATCLEHTRRGEPHDFQYRMVAADGRVVWLRDIVRVRLEDGRPVESVGVMIDVTELATAQEALGESESRLRRVVEQAGDGIVVHDLEGRFHSVNQRICEMLGYSREELLSCVRLEQIDPQCTPHVLQKVWERLQREGSYTVEAVNRRRDGVLIPVEVRVGVFEADGPEPRVVTIVRDITERRRTESALRESETRFRQLTEAIGQVFYISSPDLSRVEYVSPAYRHVWGRDPDQVRTDSLALAGAVLPEDELVLEQFMALRMRGEPAHAEYRIRRADGEIRWISDRSFPIRNPAGRVYLYAGLAEDVTARREADARLAEAEAHYRRLVVTSPVGIYALDRLGRFTELNPAGEELLQRPARDVLGRHFGDFVAIEDLERTTVAFTDILRGAHEQVELEVSVARPSGERRLLHIQISGIGSRSGVEGVHGIARDVTDERARERQTRMLAAALEGLRTEGVLITDPGGRIVYANAAHARLLGYDAAEQDRLSLRDFLPDPQARREARAIRDAVERAGSWRGTVRRRRVRDGEVVTLDALIGQVTDGERVLYIGILQDATQRLAHERQLRRVERLASLGTLISGVAHELNNPLHAITNFAELMLMDPRGPDDQEALEIIQREATRAARVVSDLRQLSRKTQEDGERGRVDLNEVVRHVAKLRRYTLDTHNILLEEDLAPGLPPVWADRPQLEQVLLNLVVNAEQAMQGREGPRRLAVRTRPEAGGVALHVEDSGPGIAPGDLERIFDPFWTTKAPGQGTGLGLSLAHSIVSEHGGEIRVDSEQGTGTAFVVTLPAECPAGRGEQRADGAPGPHRPLRVLVVDDEPANRRLLVRHLTRRGHAVDEAAEGGEALVRLAEREYDAIVADLRMPGLGGDELLADLRARDTGLDRRMVFVTGDAASGETSQILAAAGVPVLFKPVSLGELARVVEAHAEAAPPIRQPGSP